MYYQLPCWCYLLLPTITYHYLTDLYNCHTPQYIQKINATLSHQSQQLKELAQIKHNECVVFMPR